MKSAIGILGALILLAVLVYHGAERETARAAQPVPNPIAAAFQGCKAWARQHSGFAVREFADEYVIASGKLPPKHYRVGVDFRTDAAGLPMSAACEYQDSGSTLVLLSARITKR